MINTHNILVIGASGFVGSYVVGHFKGRSNLKFTFASNSIEGGIFYNPSKNSLNDIKELELTDIVINCFSPKAEQTIEDILKTVKDIAGFVEKKDAWLINVSSISSNFDNRLNDDYSFKKFLSDELTSYYLNSQHYTILKFPQIFDYAGKAKKSQSGLFYLINSINKNTPITLFKNVDSITRNYLPVELVLTSIDYVIENNIKGIHNVLVPAFTTSFPGLIQLLKESSENENELQLIQGDRMGQTYNIPTTSNEFEEWANEAQDYKHYLTKLFREYKGV